MTKVLPPKNNHPKCRQNVVFIWNGLFSGLLILGMKDLFQSRLLLLGVWLRFVGYNSKGVIGMKHCISIFLLDTFSTI